jgi:hypothetical protein
MNLSKLKFPLVKLPDEVDLAPFLIGEELKSRKFFDGLHNLDLAGCYYQTHLEKLALVNVGLNEELNENIDFYCAVIAHHCKKKLRQISDTITKQALNVYIELMIEKKRRLNQKANDL